MEVKKRQYGLILNKKTESPVNPKAKAATAFADSDDDDQKVDVTGKNKSASSLRVLKEAERMQERALAEDPTIFDYDASYDAIQEKKNEKVAEIKAKDKERQSKYAEDIIQAHKRRELEKQSREERKQQKEREQEAGEFDDKEVFVTGAYRKQMEEVQKFREEEAYEAQFNDATAVDKQKMWQSGFSRHLLNTLSRDDTSQKPIKEEVGEPEPVEASSSAPTEFRPRKLKNIRRREEDEEGKPMSPDVDDSKERSKENKRSIYDSGKSDDEDEPKQKSFVGGLKPGLNKPVAKRPQERVMTKAERLRRQFTPTSSDDEKEERGAKREEDQKKNRNRTGNSDTHHSRRRDSRSTERKRESEKKAKGHGEKTELNAAESKAKRLQGLKEILRRRNGSREIEEFRRRYLERKEQGIVIAPI